MLKFGKLKSKEKKRKFKIRKDYDFLTNSFLCTVMKQFE